MLTMYNPKTKATVKSVNIKYKYRWMRLGFIVLQQAA